VEGEFSGTIRVRHSDRFLLVKNRISEKTSWSAQIHTGWEYALVIEETGSSLPKTEAAFASLNLSSTSKTL
jgi:hypothetical protein